MIDSAAIAPGARVRATDGIVGTVERLGCLDDTPDGAQPDYMIVRSDDGRWRYNLPLLLVSSVTQGTFYVIVNLTIGSDKLAGYIAEEVGSPPPAGVPIEPVPEGEWMSPDARSALRIPLAAEEITVRKQPIELGRVHVHKGVETLEESVSVPVIHEEAIVEHIAPDQYDGRAPGPNEVIIPIVEEHLVIEKRAVITEYIRVRKNVITEQHGVRGTVRREFIEVTEQRPDGLGGLEGLEGQDGPKDRAKSAAPLVREVRTSGATSEARRS